MYEEKATTSQESQVRRELAVLGKTIEESAKALDELHARLKSVIDDRPTAVDGPTAPPVAEPLCELAQDIRHLRLNVQDRIDKIGWILARLGI